MYQDDEGGIVKGCTSKGHTVMSAYLSATWTLLNPFMLSGLFYHNPFDQSISNRWGVLFVCVEVLRPSQPNGVMSSAVSLPNHTFYWAGLVL